MSARKSAGKRRRADVDPDEPEDGKPGGGSRVAQRLRHDYRELLSDTSKHRHEYIQPGNDGLHQTLDKVDQLWQHVNVGQCREAALDSALLRNVAQMGVEQAKILNTNLISFDSLAFGDNIAAFMTARRLGTAMVEDDDEEVAPTGRRRPRLRQPLNWSKLGCHCQKFFRRRAPTVDFMYGPMALEVKEKKARERRQAQKEVAERVVPQQVDTAHSHEEATTKEVERISRLLGEQLNDAAAQLDQPVELTKISFFDFILHPSSFSQTVENIFHVSFLVKDGLVSVTIDEDDQLPYIRFNQSKDKAEEAPRQQMIVSINMKQWKELVAALNLEDEEPAIPPRPSS